LSAWYTREADAIFEGAAFREGVGVVAEGGQEVKEERLSFAFFVAFKVGGEMGEIAQGSFERGHAGNEWHALREKSRRKERFLLEHSRRFRTAEP